ncbi:unnamed protein product [Paramecium octaurelia]|uniref:Uncharacterized protein n=1 Tax=Paramecium octaurelia TaxID=43137 RepID=A0A8S1XNU1_PAROT|nr:unnamed protein product [Paramecium octaurelia]CAD8202688.1 unnamed protein product [Paramecium octaurelia]
MKSITRGNYKNVLYLIEEQLFPQNKNLFDGTDNGSCFRNIIYTITRGYGFTWNIIKFFNNILFITQI